MVGIGFVSVSVVGCTQDGNVLFAIVNKINPISLER